jgi:phosphoglycerate dehydrogenase-like enzyme
MAFDNVIVGPHVAGYTIAARENMGRIEAELALKTWMEKSCRD